MKIIISIVAAIMLSYSLSNLAYAPHPVNEILYGIDGGRHLVTIDQTNGATTKSVSLSAVGGGRTYDSGAYSPNNILYIGQGGGNPNLYTVNVSTGDTTLVGNTNVGATRVSALEFGPSGILSGVVDRTGVVGGDTLVTINTATGQATVVGAIKVGTTQVDGIEGIAFNSIGEFFGATTSLDGKQTPTLYKINTSTGAATVIGQIKDSAGKSPSGGIASLEITKNGMLLAGTAQAFKSAKDGGFLLELNPANGNIIRTIGKTTGGSSVSALALFPGDSIPPVLTVPADKTVEATSPAGALVDFAAEVTATDNVATSPTIVCTPASGSTFAVYPPPGATTVVTCTATDDAGNHAVDSFNITVVDTTPPNLTVPADITAEATSPDGATVSFTATATDIVDTSVDIVCVPASGSTFAVYPPPGATTVVNCTATDDFGNSANGSFNITVEDTTPPTITPPPDSTYEATAINTPSSDVNLERDGAASASDTVDTAPTITNNAPATYPLGDTVVTWTATDASGNSAGAPQSVRLIDIGWERETQGQFTVESSITTQIGTGTGQETLRVTDVGANTNNAVSDDILVTVTNGNTGDSITVDGQEIGLATGVFQTNAITFSTALATSDTSDRLQVSDGDIITASYTPLNPLGSAITISATSEMDDQNALGGTATSTEPIRPSSDVYAINTAGTLTFFDATRQNNGISNEVIAGVPAPGMQTPSNIDASGNTTPIKVPSTEQGDTGVFVSNHQLTFAGSGVSDRTNKVIRTNPGESVTFSYGSFTPVTSLITAPPIDSVGLATINVDYTLRLSITSDVDGDALDDSWETADGLVITYVDEDTGAISQWIQSCNSAIAGDCPSPTRKDLYVEIDYMTNHSPDAQAIEQVKTMFANSPVTNPSGPTGINLHVLVSDNIGEHTLSMPFAATATDSGFFGRKQVWFGTADERAGTCAGCVGTPEQILSLARQVRHYSLWVHDQTESPGSSGTGEVNGNDFLVSLGSYAGGRGTVGEQAATFAHELGHNLGLNHGGNAGGLFNCKPNSISVMNYAFQFANLVPNRPLDYSRVQLATLDTGHLNEAAGVQAYYYPNPTDTSLPRLSTVYGSNVPIPQPLVAETGTPIDWDRDGVLNEPDVSVAINNLGIPGCDGLNLNPTVIPGRNQWESINFNFRTSSVFENGAIQVTESFLNPDGTITIGIDEPTSEVLSSFLAGELIPLSDSIGALDPSACKDSLTNLLIQAQAIFDDPNLTRKQKLEAVLGILRQMETTINTDVACTSLPAGDLDAVIAALGANIGSYLDSTKFPVQISSSDSINSNANGVFPVLLIGEDPAILGDEAFVVRDLDILSLRYGPGLAEEAHGPLNDPKEFAKHVGDKNGDGIEDLILHFDIQQLGIGNVPSGTQINMCLIGNLADATNTPIQGCKLVTIQ